MDRGRGHRPDPRLRDIMLLAIALRFQLFKTMYENASKVALNAAYRR